MKNLVVLLVAFLVVSAALAQDSKKNTYTLKGDLIEAKLYHSNGQLAQTGYYTKDGKLHGEWESYDATGQKTATAHYANGEKVGSWTFHQGFSMKEVTYVKSKISMVKTWEVKDVRVVSNRP